MPFLRASFLPVLAVLLARLCKASSGSDTFAACVDGAPEGAYQITNPANTGSAGTCAYYCMDQAYGYSYYQMIVTSDSSSTDAPTTTSNCYCSNDFVPEDEVVMGSSACPASGVFTQGTVTTTNYYFEAHILSTTYSFNGCYSSPPLLQPDTTGQPYTSTYYTGPSTPKACTTMCGTSGYGAAIFYHSVDEPVCRCGTYKQAGTSVTCDTNEYFLYTRTAQAAAASNARRRNLRERLERTRRQVIAHCPKGLTACNVAGSEDGFECLDTQSELEACGGCLWGEFGQTNSTSTGVDCSTLPGTALGGVTCRAGTCQSSICRPGWVLQSGECVRP